jgi:hypothetical protein
MSNPNPPGDENHHILSNFAMRTCHCLHLARVDCSAPSQRNIQSDYVRYSSKSDWFSSKRASRVSCIHSSAGKTHCVIAWFLPLASASTTEVTCHEKNDLTAVIQCYRLQHTHTHPQSRRQLACCLTPQFFWLPFSHPLLFVQRNWLKSRPSA